MLIVMSVLLAALTSLHPEWVTGRAARTTDRPKMGLVLPAGREVRVRTGRIERKDQAILRLYAGELTLFQTAALFQHLNATPPDAQDLSWRDRPGADDGERLCRQVMHWAGVRWRDRCPAAELQARLDRLEQDLREHLASHGRTVLPCHVPED